MIRMLDTDICIYIIRRKPIDVLQKFIAFEPGDIGMSSITVAELVYGAEKSQQPDQNRQAVEEFLLPLSVVDFDHDAAGHYANIRASLERLGMSIGALELLIAGHARSLGVTLVTNNTREYGRVPGLNLENWVDKAVMG